MDMAKATHVRSSSLLGDDADRKQAHISSANLSKPLNDMEARNSKQHQALLNLINGSPLTTPSRLAGTSSLTEPALKLHLQLIGITVMDLHKSSGGSVVDFLQELLKEFGKADGLEHFHFKILGFFGRYLTWPIKNGQTPHTNDEVLVQFSVAPVEAKPDGHSWILEALNARMSSKSNTLLKSPYAFAIRNTIVAEAGDQGKGMFTKVEIDASQIGQMLLPLAICAAFTGMLAWLVIIV